MKNNENTISIGKEIGKWTLRVLLMIVTFVVAIAIILLASLKLFCSKSFPNVQNTFVTMDIQVKSEQLKILLWLILAILHSML